MSNFNQNLNGANTNSFIPAAVFGLTPLKDVKAGTNVPEGMRECRIIIKGDKAGEGKVSQYCQLRDVSEGLIAAFVRNPKGNALIAGFIESLQNKVVRSIYLKEGRAVNEDDLGIDQLIAIGELEGESARLTKDSIANWFTEVEPKIVGFIASTRGLDLNNPDVAAKVRVWAGNFKPLFVELAGRSPSLNPDVKSKMELVCAGIMTGTAIEEKILEKLENAVEKSADDLGL